MSTKGDVQVRVGGDVSGQITIGNHNIHIGNVNGGVVNLITPSDQPEYSRRPAPVNLRPRKVQSFFDREEEIIVLQKAVNEFAAVSVYGEEGIGKSTFVSRFVNSSSADIFPDGVVYLDALDRGLEDLLQALFEILYVSKSDFKPSEAALRLALSEIKALIVLDHLRLPQDKIKPLLNYIPQCAVVLSGIERNLWGTDGMAILLQGLPPKDALSLFEHELGHLPEGEEKVAAEKIIELLHGHPLHISQTVSLVREKSRTISDVLLLLEKSDPAKALVELSLGGLTEPQKRDLAILAASGDAIVPLEHLVSLSQDQNTRKSLRELMSLRLVQAHSPSYSLTGNLAAAFASQWDLSGWEDTLIDYFTNWLEKNPTQALVEESAEVLIHVIRKAGERKRWQNVIRMGRKLESVLALWKRWQSWADILELILKAAKAIGDKKVEGWVLHQLGSRAMCLDLIEPARTLLTQAANIRRAIGDQAGLEITQHNLSVLGKAVMPFKTQQKTGCRRCCVSSGIGIGVAILVGVAAFIFVVAKTLDFFSTDNKTVRNTDIPPMTSVPSMPTFTPIQQENVLPPATETYTVTPSFTPTPTDTLTYTPTPTFTVTPTFTFTPSFTPTLTSTRTPSPTNTFNAPPSTPVIEYPGMIICDGKPVALRWGVPYDAGGIVEYQVWLQVNQNNKWFDISGGEYTTTPQLDITWAIQKYCGYRLGGRVRAKDNEGVWGDWSPWTDFDTKVPNIPPEKPVILYPKEYETRVCDGTSVVLEWNVPYDAGGVAEYQVGLQINQNGQRIDISGGGYTTVSRFDITEAVKKYCGYKMSAHVRAKDNEGMWGEWSLWRDFYTKIPNTPPPAPKITKPLNKAEVNCTGTVSLEWAEPYDPSGIAGYGLRFEVYDTNKKQWVRIITKENYVPTKLDVTSWTSCGLQFRWSVQAVDKEGAIGAWSTWAVFYPVQMID